MATTNRKNILNFILNYLFIATCLDIHYLNRNHIYLTLSDIAHMYHIVLKCKYNHSDLLHSQHSKEVLFCNCNLTNQVDQVHILLKLNLNKNLILCFKIKLPGCNLPPLVKKHN